MPRRQALSRAAQRTGRFSTLAVRPFTWSKANHLGLEPLEQRLALTTLPTGFTETLVTTNSNLSSPTAMDFSPTGELWVLEQAGDVEFIRSDGSKHTALDLTVDSAGERGLLGIAFDPAYDGAGPNTDYVYLYYTKPRTGTNDPANNQVVRYTVNGAGTTTPTLVDEQMIRELPPEDEDNNPATNGDTNHNGGAIHFGPDGKLYVAVGDHNYDPPGAQQATHPSQVTDTPFGKMLRLNPDGTNPTDNPFYNGSPTNWEGSIWTLGLRNPYTFAIDPADGRVFINDVGEGGWEEINAGEPGANFGWAGSNSPVWEGFENDGTPPPWTNYHDPIMAYNHSSDPPTPAAVDITGGAFYPANSQFGAAFAGKYFFADAGANFIRYFDPANPGTVGTPDTSSAFASNLTTFGPVDLKVDVDGNLYYLARGGEVYRISYTGDYGPSEVLARRLFYNNSAFDGNDPAADETDDNAIAPGIVAYRAGDGTAVPENVSSYSRGINGVMIDVAGNHGPLSIDDFQFRVGDSNDLGAWTAAPAPSSIVVRPGAGDSGSSRIELIWADGAIANTWLEVTLEGDDAAGGFNTSTGLSQSDTFYFGSRLGDALVNSPASLFVTNVNDEIGARNNVSSNRPITNVYDFDRNGLVNVADQIVARNNIGLLTRISVTGTGTPAIASASSEAERAAVASALSIEAAEPTANEARAEVGPAAGESNFAERGQGRGVSLLVDGKIEGQVGRRLAGQALDLALDDELLAELLDSALS